MSAKRGPKPGPVLTPRQKGELAERMVPVAAELACAVREKDADGIGEILAGLDAQELTALAVVLAAMVPVDDPVSRLLGWVTWGGDGEPAVFPPAVPQLPLSHAETRQEYVRLRSEGLCLDAAAAALKISLRTAQRHEEFMYEEREDAA